MGPKQSPNLAQAACCKWVGTHVMRVGNWIWLTWPMYKHTAKLPDFSTRARLATFT